MRIKHLNPENDDLDAPDLEIVFDSHRNRFLVNERFSIDLDVSQLDMYLVFTEKLDDDGGGDGGSDNDGDRGPLTFDLALDGRTFKEIAAGPEDPDEDIGRSEVADLLVKEFLRDLPDDIKTLLRDDYKKNRVTICRMYGLIKVFLESSVVVSHTTAMKGCHGVMMDWDKADFVFQHRGSRYLIEDQHCMLPKCDCRKVALFFHARPEGADKGTDISNVVISLDGEVLALGPIDHTPQEAEDLLRAWLASRPNILKELEERRVEMKDMGGFAIKRVRGEMLSRVYYKCPFDNLEKRMREETAGSEAGPASGKTAKHIPKDKVVARGDPCPCGSGKKYKKCCGSMWK